MLFQVKKQLEHGVSNLLVARLTLQIVQLLEKCDLAKDTREAIVAIYLNSLIKALMRCWEIEQRIRADYEKAVAKFKPAAGAAAIEVPQIPRLDEDCRNFLYEAKNYLRDLLRVFNLLYGTSFNEASEWFRPPKKKLSMQDFARVTFGEGDLKTRFLKQIPSCLGPYVDMRNAVEHPGGYSGTLHISNIALDSAGNLQPPVWWREKGGQIEYGPLSILDDMRIGVNNLFIAGEDVAVMWIMQHLLMPQLTVIAVIPEAQRNPACAIKYTTQLRVPTPALLE